LVGRAGIILADIEASGLKVVSFGVFWLNKPQADEFYEIYNRIFAEAEFMAMAEELAVGPCMAVELSYPSDGCNVVEYFRACCGPADSVCVWS
jgi:nucleoside-diphosphate kinase